jgi:hypothetical protein
MWPLLLFLLVVPLPSGAAGQETTLELDRRPRKLDCTRLDWMKIGRPVFASGQDGVRVGISTKKDVVAVGEPVVVDLWIDNQSDKPVKSGGRCPPYRYSGDVFDAAGHRLIGIREQSKLDAEKNGGTTVEVCASTEILIEVPAHTCMAPVDAHGDNYVLDYKLTPGEYYVFPARGVDPALYRQGLKITVRQP